MKNMTNDASALLDFVAGISSVSPADGKKITDELSPKAVPVKSTKGNNKGQTSVAEDTPVAKEKMRTSIYIDKPLYRKFKAFSVDVNSSITDLLTAAITDMLESGKLPKSLNK